MFSKRISVDITKKIPKWRVKVLDVKRDLPDRTSHLRKLNDNLSENQFMLFISENHLDIFILFYEEFMHLEAYLKNRGGIRTCADHLRFLCHTLKLLFLSVPHIIRAGNYYHAIHLILRKLIHISNYPKVRCYGVELCLIWLMCLQDRYNSHASNLLTMIFVDLHPNLRHIYENVPEDHYCILKPDVEAAYTTSESQLSRRSLNVQSLFWDEANPFAIVPPHERSIIDRDRQVVDYFKRILSFTINNLTRINWVTNEQIEDGFESVFYILKKHIIYKIFFISDSITDLYFLNDDYESITTRNNSVDQTCMYPVPTLRHYFTKWILSVLTDFKKYITLIKQKVASDSLASKKPQTSKGDQTDQVVIANKDDEQNIMLLNEELMSSTSIEDNVVAIAIAKKIFFRSFNHMALILEVFRQNLMNLHIKRTYKIIIIDLLRFWCKPKNLPMCVAFADSRNFLEALNVAQSSSANSQKPCTNKYYRLMFYLSFVTFYCEFSTIEILIESVPNLSYSISFCRSVILHYSTTLDNESWIKMLDCITQIFSHFVNINMVASTLSIPVKEKNFSTFLSFFFQTVFLCWLRGNLYSIIPSHLWDKFLDILQNTPHCCEIFKQWLSAAEIITRIYCFKAFKVDIYNLPLDRELDTRRKLKNITGGKDVAQKRAHRSTISFTKIDVPLPLSPSSPINTVIPEGELLVSQSKLTVALTELNTLQTPPIAMSSAVIEPSKNIRYSPNKFGEKKATSHRKKHDARMKSYSVLVSRESAMSVQDISCTSSFYNNKSKQLAENTAPIQSAPDLLQQVPGSHDTLKSDILTDQEDNTSISTFHEITESLIKTENDTNVRFELPIGEEMDDNKFGNLSQCSMYYNREHLFVIWRRFLGLFGNINYIYDSKIQVSAYQAYFKIFEQIEIICKNYGLDSDLKYSLQVDQEQPMLQYFIPLAFETLLQKKAHISVILEAEKLALRSILSPYNLSIFPSDFTLLFSSIFSDVLETKSDDTTLIFFENCQNLLTSSIDTPYLLFNSILIASESYLSKNRQAPLQMAILLLSMCQYFLAFPDLNGGLSDSKFVTINNLFPTYVEIVFMGSTWVSDFESRCTFLCCLNQILLEYVFNKIDCDLVLVMLSIILKHLYSSSIKTVSMVCNFLSCYIAYFDQFKIFKDTLMDDILFYVLKCIPAIVDKHTKCQDSTFAFNTLIEIVNVITELIFKSPTEQNLKILFHSLGAVNHGSSEIVEFISSPNLYPFELPCTHSCSKFNSIINGIVDVTEPNNNAAVSATRQESEDICSRLQDENNSGDVLSLLKEREYSFYAHLQQLSDLCFLMLYNCPLPSGPSTFSSQINENDLIQTCKNLNAADFLVVCLRNHLLISICEFHEGFEGLFEVDPHHYTDSFKEISDKLVLIIRTPIGRYVWLVSELKHKFSEYVPSSSHMNFTTIHDPIEQKNVDPLNNLLSLATNGYPEIASHYSYNKNTQFPSFPNSALVNKLTESLHNPSLYSSKECIAEYSPSITARNFPIQQSHFRYKQFMQLFSQFSLYSHENRKFCSIIESSEKFFRDAKQLDNRSSRSPHKIAIFFVKPGQEDKDSILRNTDCSQKFESFLYGMGWMIDLNNHTGFSGGLEKNYMKECKTIYFCSMINQVIFHIAPMMPFDGSQASLISKLRHLGNDEVHIVWSEHFRPFRRGIINTEFGNVIIVIYPRKDGLFKINIIKQESIPIFGPLVDGSIVPFRLLPILVRETAINASNCIRMSHTLYKTPYDDRLQVIRQLVDRHRLKQSFEQFLASFL